ncbi:putative sugar uptake ABC transporter ATP-binding protein [Oceanicola granulosus HTCC2516]|uniref:Putative sugar uptake ABC transporter ATP-binding protein n=2 Tax=Oceanicola granulosus TaxID=252302 RepID=Q2CGD5_OCEGH|nr:putative sugar uptake ABC transporter ATP-binding protein [Oceanicola granulosus HTCC2516]
MDLMVRNLRKSFGAVEVLRDIDFHIHAGEFVCFLGPSGCGKSTLLRCIAGLEEIDDGEIRLGGREIDHLPSAKRDISMVFQSYALYPHMTVAKNMSFGLRLNGMPRDEVDRRIAHAAQVLQIEPLLGRKPKALSGGQRQRVAIGRAIVREPSLFLLDEPLSNLDAALRVTMRAELAALHARLGTTMVYVTHDQVEAMTLSSRVVVLDKGSVSQFGPPMELFHRPANLFVAGFIGTPQMNFLPARLLRAHQDRVEVEVEGAPGALSVPLAAPVRLAPGAPLTLGVRPDALTLGLEAGPQVAAKVTLVERLGTESHVLLARPDGTRLTAITDAPRLPGPGATVTAGFAPEAVHLFDETGRALPRCVSPEIAALLDSAPSTAAMAAEKVTEEV